MNRTAIRGLAAAVLVVVPLLAGTPASAAPTPLLFAQGVVASGPATVAGVTVNLVWLPGTATAQVGDVLTPRTLATATADARGHYALTLDPPAGLLREIAANDQWANLSVVALTGTGVPPLSISRRWTGSSWAGNGERPLFAPTAQVRINVPAGAVNRVASAPVVPPGAQCTFVIREQGNKYTRIMDFHNDSNVDGTWEYGSTADSTIDAAFAYNGGSWSISGSRQISDSAAGTMSGTTVHRYNSYVRTGFNYLHGQWKRADGNTTDRYCSNTSEINMSHENYATGWNGGAIDDGQYPHQYCFNYRQTYRSGQSISISATRATKIGFAVDAFGAHLGQTSGFSTRADQRYSVRRGNGAYICGKYGYPLSSEQPPGVIYVQNL